MWRALRWVIWYAVNFCGDIKDEIRRVELVRGNEERYLKAKRDLDREYRYFDYYKGWCYVQTAKPFPPTSDDVKDFRFLSKEECLDAGLCHLKSIESR